MTAPNLNTLRAFEAAARHLALRKAADELTVTTGAVSQQIKQLEKDLDVLLFTRHRRGLTLTEAGHRLNRGVAPALEEISKAIAELKSFSDRISLQTSPSLVATWLAPRLPRFALTHPDIDLTIRSQHSLPGSPPEADFLLHLGDPPPLPGYRAEHLAPIRLVAVTGPDLVSRAPVIARASFFAQYPLLEDDHQRWRNWFALNGPDTPFEAHDAGAAALALARAEAGEGIALVPEILARDALAAHRLVLLKEMGEEPGGLILYSATAAPQIRARQTVADWIRAEI